MGEPSAPRRHAVFLDRDGVLNEVRMRDRRPLPPASAADLMLTDRAAESCAALKDAGFLLVVVTNQPDVARGSQTRDAVADINRHVLRELPLDDVRVCYHDDADECGCRKPAPGLILDAASDWGIDVSSSFLVGDRWRDIEAGRRAGCRTVFVDRGYDESLASPADHRVLSFAEAAAWIVAVSERAEP